MSPMLEVKDLVVAYGKIKAVKGISFTVEEGEVVTLIGTNAFSGLAGQLRLESGGGLLIVLGDVDGDGVADLIIHLYNMAG